MWGLFTKVTVLHVILKLPGVGITSSAGDDWQDWCCHSRKMVLVEANIESRQKIGCPQMVGFFSGDEQ